MELDRYDHLILDAPHAIDAPDGARNSGETSEKRDEDGAVSDISETELILDPDPNPEWVEEILSRRSLRVPTVAMEHLNARATESVRFLSGDRGTMFLAGPANLLAACIDGI